MQTQTVTTTVSSANQSAIPSGVRKTLGLKPGDKLFWQIEPKKKEVKVKAAPKKWGDYMQGLGKEVWKGIDTDKYLKESRKDRKIIW